MPITVCANLHYKVSQSCDILLQIEAAQDATQRCLQETLTISPDLGSRQIEGEDGIGIRRWLVASQNFRCQYQATFEINRPATRIEDLRADPVSQTPGPVTKYLMPSRYCHPEAFISVLADNFAALSGGALVTAISHWINDSFTYDISASTGVTTATQSLAARAGVCRDYAHVLIAMVRSAGIPARYVSAYAPDVHPQDFHALVEVYLNGAWHLIDPTGMADPSEVIRIGVGRDAADASFLTSYGYVSLESQSVEVLRNDIAMPAL